MLSFHHCRPAGLVGAEGPGARGGRALSLLGSRWEPGLLVAISLKGQDGGRRVSWHLWSFSGVLQVSRVGPSLWPLFQTPLWSWGGRMLPVF